MNIIYIVLVFCVVLFFYLHVFFHIKTSDDLEVYEIDNPSKEKLEEICDLRQPILFEYSNERILDTCKRTNILDNYGAFDVKLRNIKDTPKEETGLHIPIAYSNALKIVNDDTEEKYLVENNMDFLEETSMIKSFKYNDNFLRPYMISSSNYDFLIATEGLKTPFKYELNYRNYVLVCEGDIKIKLAPPKSSKYLYQEKDYENFEFTSPINPWNVQSQYKADFDKIKCLNISMKKGQILFIPAYWWYSIEFGENTSIATFKYKTYMNTVAISPHIIMNLLQSQNVKRDNLKKIVVNDPIVFEQQKNKDSEISQQQDFKINQTSLQPSEPEVLHSETSLDTNSIN
jgi:hypothetical protein